jgi:hypothetical protein
MGEMNDLLASLWASRLAVPALPALSPRDVFEKGEHASRPPAGFPAGGFAFSRC